MSYVIQLINDMKIRNKLILSFVVVVLVPVAIVGFFLTGELRRSTFNNAQEAAYQNVERVKKRTMEVVNVAVDLAYRLSYDERLKSVASREYTSIYDVVRAYQDYPDLRQAIEMYKEISNIRFYSENPTMLNNWEFIYPEPGIRKADWYVEAERQIGLMRWNYIEDERDRRKYLSLVKGVPLGGKDNSGILVINVNTGLLNTILGQESFDTILVDSKNNIVASNRKELYGGTLSDIPDEAGVIYNGKGSYESVIHGEASRVLIEPLASEASMDGLRIISIFSIDSIMKDANRTNRLAMTVIAVSLLLAVVLIYGFSSLISSRLLRLSKHITKVGTGNLDISMKIDGKDEIGQLSRQFNSMVSSINELMTEVQSSHELKRKMEQKQNEIKFKMMSSQINPHFLFNALESIRMEAHLKGQPEIANVVRLLGKMMRSCLEVGSGTITLKEEIDMAACYLDIQKFRYENRLKFVLDIDPEAEIVRLPPLIIQPLVENAVVHGMDNKEEGTVIRVTAAMSDSGLAVAVEDNGAGISPERLDRIRATLGAEDEEEGGRIGLRNVHERLRLAYGAGSGLQLESRVGQGTRITFTISAEGRE